MKSIRKYIGFSMLGLSLALVSCNDFLDKNPDSRMELTSPEECSKILVTAYPETNATYLLEMYSDNTDQNDKTGWTEFNKFQGQAYRWEDITETTDYESPKYLWTTHYAAVATANQVLDHIEKLSAEEQSSYAAQKGEALLCRAYAMFQLSNVFCMAYDKTTADQYMGLPYPKHVDETIDTQYERGTLEELYANIEADLKAGIPLLTDNYTQPKFHFTPSSAAAFAERFYLYYQQYDKAVAYADQVLGSDPRASLRDWASWSAMSYSGQIQPNAFVNSSNKANLLLQICYSMWGAIGGPFPAIGNKFSHNKVIAEKETLLSNGLWGKTNENLNFTCLYNTQVTSKYMMIKIPYAFEYYDIQANTGAPHSVYAVFTTDISLIERAEAYALMGEYEKAMKDINTELSVFANTGLSYTLNRVKSFYGSNLKYYEPDAATPKKAFHTSFPIDSETQEPLLDCILHLKRILTMHEGFRLQDVKRYGMTMYRRTIVNDDQVSELTDSIKAGDPRLAIQLPQDVIKVGLHANPRNIANASK